MDVDISKLLKDEGLSKTQLQVGKEVEGTVISQDRTKIYFDLSPLGTGVIYKVDFQESPLSKGIKGFPVGSVVKARVADIENEEGFIELSLKELSAEAAFEDLYKKLQNKETLRGRVVNANKGGLLVDIAGITGFLPSSQLAPEHYPRASSGESDEILKKLKALVGQDLSLRLLSIDEGKQTFVASEKLALEKNLQERLMQFKEGDEVEGEVTSITNFGVFVKFATGIEGLVHISELDWKLIAHPSEVLKIGDKVRAKVIKIKGGEVSLSLRALKKDPWSEIEKNYTVGQIVKARVKEHHPFGAFAFLNEHIHGLVHISQFGSPKRMEKMLPPGEEFSFEITSIVPAEHRMGLKFLTKEETPRKEEATEEVKKEVKEENEEKVEVSEQSSLLGKKVTKPKTKKAKAKTTTKKKEPRRTDPKKISEKKPKKPSSPKKIKR